MRIDELARYASVDLIASARRVPVDVDAASRRRRQRRATWVTAVIVIGAVGSFSWMRLPDSSPLVTAGLSPATADGPTVTGVVKPYDAWRIEGTFSDGSDWVVRVDPDDGVCMTAVGQAVPPLCLGDSSIRFSSSDVTPRWFLARQLLDPMVMTLPDGSEEILAGQFGPGAFWYWAGEVPPGAVITTAKRLRAIDLGGGAGISLTELGLVCAETDASTFCYSYLSPFTADIAHLADGRWVLFGVASPETTSVAVESSSQPTAVGGLVTGVKGLVVWASVISDPAEPHEVVLNGPDGELQRLTVDVPVQTTVGFNQEP